MVWQSGDYGMVERPLVERRVRGVCRIYWNRSLCKEMEAGTLANVEPIQHIPFDTMLFLGYEQSLFFLSSSSSRGKEIAKDGTQKLGREKVFLRLDKLKRKNRDCL